MLESTDKNSSKPKSSSNIDIIIINSKDDKKIKDTKDDVKRLLNSGRELTDNIQGNVDIDEKLQSHTRNKKITKKTVTIKPQTEKIELAPLVEKICKTKASFKYWTKNKEEKMGQDRALAFIMMGYVMVFLICHSPRLLLNIYELAAIR